ncbi:hypothetical protein, partial [Acidianus sp. RZ1]
MSEKKRKKSNLGVSNTIFVGIVVVLIIIAAVGFALYGTKPSVVATTTKSITITSSIPVTSTQTKTSTVTSTATTTVTSTVVQPVMYNLSAGFYNGEVITFNYTMNFECTTPSSNIFPNQSVEQAVDGCEVGVNSTAYPAGAAPVYVIVPAFAGLSIFGNHGPLNLGATPQGLPVFSYNNSNYTIITQCGADLTPAACPDHMPLIYSPAFTAVEQHIGIKNGVLGLPEGVLPTPAHEHIVTFTTNTSIPWYIVVVLVFNPNIYPNGLTGQCQQIV